MAEASDRWIGIGLDRQIRPASSNPAMIDGSPVAVWRAEKGPVNVWEDRCPHRGMRLSFGFVRGDRLRCIYHGWGYESGGQCALIPAHPDLTPPKTIRAAVYPSITRYGIVWTNLSQTPTASLPEIGEEEDWQPVRTLYVRGSADAVREGLRRFDHGDGLGVEAGGTEAVILRSAAGPQLMFAVQPVDAGRTGLHVVVRGEEASDPRARLAMAKRLERLRGVIEAR